MPVHGTSPSPNVYEAIQKFLALIPCAIQEHPEAGSRLVGEATGGIQKIQRPFPLPQSAVRWSHRHITIFPFAQGENGYGPIACPV
jgi:hypothetical protein